MPFGERWNRSILKKLGVHFKGHADSVWIANSRFVGGPFSNLSIGDHSNILDDCFFYYEIRLLLGIMWI